MYVIRKEKKRGDLTMPIRMNKIKFFTTEEIELMLPISVQAIRQYIRSGRIHGIKIGRLYYISNASLNEFLETGGVKNISPQWRPKALGKKMI